MASVIHVLIVTQLPSFSTDSREKHFIQESKYAELSFNGHWKLPILYPLCSVHLHCKPCAPSFCKFIICFLWL